VEVAAGAADAQMKQHDVKVSFAAGRFTVEPEVLSIAQGDMVLWHAPNGRALPYTVVGEKPFFASDRLVNESGYSHAFGAAGEYRWRDAHGGRTEGLVRVRDPQCGTKADLDAWHAALATGTVVTITDGVATPKEVSILTGQTVFFAVTKGPGLSITDARLLEGEGRRTAS
jgi:plastocyanin